MATGLISHKVEFRCHISDPQSFTILLIGAPCKKEQHRSNASLSLEKRRSRLVLVNQLSTFHQSTKDFVFLFFDGLERERERHFDNYHFQVRSPLHHYNVWTYCYKNSISLIVEWNSQHHGIIFRTLTVNNNLDK